MTSAELRCLRESLGLSIAELAAVLGLDARAATPRPDEPALASSARKPRPLDRKTINRWERDLQPISKANAEALARLIAYTDRAVAAIVEAHDPSQPIITYTDGVDLNLAERGLWPTLPASWHRAVAWRAAQQIPGATITYSA
jgi:transcriptional regulator with XRE-family HTH domain